MSRATDAPLVARAMLFKSLMRSTIQVRTVPVRPALVVHAECDMRVVDEVLGPVWNEVMSWAGEHRVYLAGPAVARFAAQEDGRHCEIDAGYVVEGPVELGDERVRAVAIGGCDVACATHIGSHESLEDTYGDIEDWIEEHGYESAGHAWEEYSDPPGTPERYLRTDVFWPITKKGN